MNPTEFAHKWRDHQLSERASYVQHFLDLCALVGHPSPAEVDRTGESFTFEKGVTKFGGKRGWADVWKKGHFAWEYKKQGADLNRAYEQLLQYREALESPPLLIVSDTRTVIIRTNFTGTLTETHQIDLFDLTKAEDLALLRAVFFEPNQLRPGRTTAQVTGEAAQSIAEIALRLRQRGHEPHRVARFLDRVVFCMFAEDIDLLPRKLFTKLLEKRRFEPEKCRASLESLFASMATGEDFGADDIRHFNGSLFDDAEALLLTETEIKSLCKAAQMDWKEIDPSIFGTLFERGLDPGNRAQLGAHYTCKEDIEVLVEPVVMAPLRAEWERVKAEVEGRLEGVEKLKMTKERQNRLDAALLPVQHFLHDLAAKRVLDPACGSGNFLYTALQRMKDLEKEVIIWASAHGFGTLLPRVHPRQLYGIEINVYAFELAQLSVWIGYLQWIHRNGFGNIDDPVLQALQEHFLNQDAILQISDDGRVSIPEWPEADFIIGNPPFLGGKLLRRNLGDEYVNALFQAYEGKVGKESDLCCYWFERARQELAARRAQRAGLLGTQGIRGKANRGVLEAILKSGGIFFAESDRDWVLDGANVHVSMVGFDRGEERRRVLDGKEVPEIHANLGGEAGLTQARTLRENLGIAFMGITPAGPFDLTFEEALELLHQPNPSGLPNSDVLRPYINGKDLNQRPSNRWTIDFGEMSREEAAQYEGPFRIIEERVKPIRSENRRASYRAYWWRYAEPRPAMRKALSGLKRYLATSRVAKHRLFSWLPTTALPDSAVIAFAQEEDFLLGVLSSRIHAVWAGHRGTQLEDRPRYTPTTCFETFAFPRVTKQQNEAIAAAARRLDELRSAWLNPPEWTEQRIFRFPCSTLGPWSANLVHAADGSASAAWAISVPRNARAAPELRARTLTHLYNRVPAWLRDMHAELDHHVSLAYGLTSDTNDSAILAALGASNV